MIKLLQEIKRTEECVKQHHGNEIHKIKTEGNCRVNNLVSSTNKL